GCFGRGPSSSWLGASRGAWGRCRRRTPPPFCSAAQGSPAAGSPAREHWPALARGPSRESARGVGDVPRHRRAKGGHVHARPLPRPASGDRDATAKGAALLREQALPPGARVVLVAVGGVPRSPRSLRGDARLPLRARGVYADRPRPTRRYALRRDLARSRRPLLFAVLARATAGGDQGNLRGGARARTERDRSGSLGVGLDRRSQPLLRTAGPLRGGGRAGG